jgi:hypothetical protein
MRRMWNEGKAHRLAATLFLLYWLVAFGLDAFGWRKPENRPDMVPTIVYLHFLLPVMAGALVGWWRRETPGRIAGGMVAGAVVLVVDAAAVLAHQWIAFNFGKTGDGGERITELPVFLIGIGLVGSLLGLIGAAGATGLSHLVDRWRKGAAVSAPPPADHGVAGDVGLAVRPAIGRVGGIMPRRLLWAAGGLALGTAVIVAFGVIPALAADGIAWRAPRAIPAFAVNAILNVLIGIAMLAPVARRSAGAGKVLVVIGGFVSLLMGFALLDAAFAIAVGEPVSLLAAVACSTGAGCNLGAGVLVLVAAFRRHERSRGGPLPVS